MPRVKPLVTKPHAKLCALIAGYREEAGVEWQAVAEMAGFSRSTLHVRRHKPETFTLDELSRIRRGLNIPLEEMREAIRL